MSRKFHKNFVRVEWMAFQKAVDLLREAGFDDTYFVCQSMLRGDEGQAIVRADMGRELFDGDGNYVTSETLRASDLGLAGDIGEFAPRPDEVNQSEFFLQRTYSFEVIQRGAKYGYVSIWVTFVKRTEEDDWSLYYEQVTDQRRGSANCRIIDRLFHN